MVKLTLKSPVSPETYNPFFWSIIICCTSNKIFNFFLLTGPNGSVIGSQITRLKNGVYRAEYEPEIVGTFRIEVLHQGKPISTHPFYVEVTDPTSVRITEIHEAFAGKESYFIRMHFTLLKISIIY